MTTLDDRVALVTGAGGGIGRATVLALARAGARVVAADIAADRAAESVAITSSSAHRPQPRTPLYTASKHAVLGLVRACAVDLARTGIRVNAVSPGAVDTPMLRDAIARRRGDPERTARALNPMHRFGEPAEVAEAVTWLCSDAASFVTGHALAVDGGMLAR